MSYDSRDECESDGGVWDNTKEICSLDLDGGSNTGTNITQGVTVQGSSESSTGGAILTVFGLILTMTVFAAPIGIPLMVFGIGIMLFPDQKLYVALVSIFIFIAIWGFIGSLIPSF